MLLVTAVVALSSAGTTTMVVNDNNDNDNIAGLNAPQDHESRGKENTTTRYYPLLALLPLSAIAAGAAAYYIYR